jgi:hypothetical protein
MIFVILLVLFTFLNSNSFKFEFKPGFELNPVSVLINNDHSFVKETQTGFELIPVPVFVNNDHSFVKETRYLRYRRKPTMYPTDIPPTPMPSGPSYSPTSIPTSPTTAPSPVPTAPTPEPSTGQPTVYSFEKQNHTGFVLAIFFPLYFLCGITFMLTFFCIGNGCCDSRRYHIENNIEYESTEKNIEIINNDHCIIKG